LILKLDLAKIIKRVANKNTIERAKIVSELLNKNYQEGRHDRCKSWVYKNVVYKQIPISKRTFFSYLKINAEQTKTNQENKFITPEIPFNS
jgi:hypothetical protein